MRHHVLMTVAAILSLYLCGCSHTKSTERSGQTTFSSPEKAADALVAAVRLDDQQQLQNVLGPGAKEIIYSGDPTADTQRRQVFLRLYDQKHSVVREQPASATLIVGDSEWPFPVPLAKSSNRWLFDTDAGKEEILNRRIGRNEISAIEVCQAIADAQREYASQDPDGDGVHEYAQQFASDPGKRNGLYWPSAEGEQPSPLGELAASAAAEGYRRNDTGPSPYHGYFYRVLHAQGPNAPGGELQYVTSGHMSLGYAVLAYPAEYGNSGVMTFLMGPDGNVRQKDLGSQTQDLAARIQSYDPDPTWIAVQQSFVTAKP